MKEIEAFAVEVRIERHTLMEALTTLFACLRNLALMEALAHIDGPPAECYGWVKA